MKQEGTVKEETLIGKTSKEIKNIFRGIKQKIGRYRWGSSYIPRYECLKCKSKKAFYISDSASIKCISCTTILPIEQYEDNILRKYDLV